MIRLVKFTFAEQEFTLASMSWAQAEKHSAEGKELLAKGDKATADDWLARMARTCTDGIRGHAGEEKTFTVDQLKQEFDKPTLEAVYNRLLEISGLKIPDSETGGAAAA